GPGYPTSGWCGSNSTILVATSPDGGLTWSTTTFPTDNLSVTSLQAGIEGRTAAVAWLGATTACSAQVGRVGAISSGDAGATWSPVENVGTAQESIATGGGLEMAPENLGILIAFRTTSLDAATSQLSLWQLSDTGAGSFGPVTEIPAPVSWTLQGDPGTPAYLLTPTYLIPLVSPPYTAIPFNELQVDGGGIGVLPRVVGLVATGPSQVEIAATTSNNLGVDCWRIDTTHGAVTRSCHVPIDSSLLPASPALPIVALIDGGGWWSAIGASGSACTPGCPPYSGPPGASSSGGASVGTSVCITGCSSAQGLAAYSYSQDSATHSTVPNAIAAVLSGAGTVVLFAVAWSNRRRGRAAPIVAADTGPSDSARADADPLLRPIRRAYLAGLAVWVVLWAPLSFLAFLSGSGPDTGSLWVAIVVGGVVGAVATFPIHHMIRQRLQRVHGIFGDQLLGQPPTELADYAFDRVRAASYFAYASWAAGLAVVVVLWTVLAGGPGPGGASAYGPVSTGPSPAALALVATLLLFVALRSLYHLGIERAVSARPSNGADPGNGSVPRGPGLRTQLGALLLPWNPLVGLILGVALQSVLPWSAYLVAWAFLPVTLLGVALLSGCIGKTTWTPKFLSVPAAAPD
ncbi:MAG TPA: hypothetical protein VIZ68_01815, partial [Thermoplasmata archaeon]